MEVLSGRAAVFGIDQHAVDKFMHKDTVSSLACHLRRDPKGHAIVLEMRCCSTLSREAMHNGLVAQVIAVSLCQRGAMSVQVEGQLVKFRCQRSVNGR